jgi:hypothetical protein
MARQGYSRIGAVGRNLEWADPNIGLTAHIERRPARE